MSRYTKQIAELQYDIDNIADFGLPAADVAGVLAGMREQLAIVVEREKQELATGKRYVERAYTVAGYYRDNMQRYATTVQAVDPLQAEENVSSANPGLTVVATFEGSLTPADGQTYVYDGDEYCHEISDEAAADLESDIEHETRV